MKWPTIHPVLVTAVFMSVCGAGLSQAGELRAWGLNGDGQVTGAPAGGDYIAIAAGDAHGLALRSDGVVVAWGRNDNGQCNVPIGVYREIGAGADFSLAINSDGAIVAWGYDGRGQVSAVPEGRDFVAVDGGEFFAVALKADGSLVAWGNDRWGQVSDVPAGTDFKAVVAGDDHAVALRSDGSLAAWGYWAAVEGTPTSGTFVAIAAGGTFSMALRDDGSIVWWGDDRHGYDLALVPRGEDFVAISAGYLHGLTLKRDGSLVGWGAGVDASGHPNWGQAAVPSGNGFQAIAGGLYFSLALAAQTEPDGPTDATAVSDDFNDNRLGIFWRLAGDDLANCLLAETNQRLELLTTSKARGDSAYCVGSNWQIDPAGDFSFKVDYHYDLVTDESGWLFLGLRPDANDLQPRHITVGVGCDRQSPYFLYGIVDSERTEARSTGRLQSDGSLYVSYEAARDRLFLSAKGYGAENAWAVFSNVLKASWGGAPVTVFLGGGADALEVTSGAAWFDNFAVDVGILSGSVEGPLSEVYRFWSPVLGRHFYTIDATERDTLVREYPDIWTYEGPVFKAATSAFGRGLSPVYRFWSPKGQSHFYTIDEAEKSQLMERGAGVWTYEGVVFYAYPEGAQPEDCVPIYRFWNSSEDSYFYTMDEVERDKFVKEYSKLYTYQGVAFYAYPL